MAEEALGIIYSGPGERQKTRIVAMKIINGWI